MKILALPQHHKMINVIESEQTAEIRWSFSDLCDMYPHCVMQAPSAEKAVIAKGMVLYTEESFPQVARAYYDSSD